MKDNIGNLNYLAGLFDGEGWFSIRRADGSRARNKREFTFQCMAGLGMKSKAPVELMKFTFGGSISTKAASDKHAKYFVWQGIGNTALEVAKRLGPLMIVKRDHARIIRLFQNQRRLRKFRALTDEEYQMQVDMHEIMRKLNHRGPSLKNT